MLQPQCLETPAFPALNTAYNQVFQANKLSLGLVVPVEAYPDSPVPTMQQQIQRVQLAESLGFMSVWLRDVPFNVPSFGDAGQVFDPFVYLGLLAGQTSHIALGVASLILPLRHPAHVAKAAASVDSLSGGRLLLGIASGDRPEEYPAMGVKYHQRGALFQQSYDYIRRAAQASPHIENHFGTVRGQMDLLPKPHNGQLPLLITGASQQAPNWLAQHGDGWITYPRPQALQAKFIENLRITTSETGISKPVMEPLYIDITEDPDHAPQAIHLGYRLGIKSLRNYLRARQEIGVNHVALNLRFNQRNVPQTLYEIAEHIMPEYN